MNVADSRAMLCVLILMRCQFMQRLYQRKFVRSRFQNAVRKLKGGLGAQILQDRANSSAISPLPEPGSVYGGLAAVPEGDHEEESDHHGTSHSVHTPPNMSRSRVSLPHLHSSPHSKAYLSPRSHLHQNDEENPHHALDSKISAGLMNLMNVEVSHHENEVVTKALHSMENILEGSGIGSVLGIHSSPNHRSIEDYVTDYAPMDLEDSEDENDHDYNESCHGNHHTQHHHHRRHHHHHHHHEQHSHHHHIASIKDHDDQSICLHFATEP